MKKFISSIIALAMVLSMLPMTIASAADATALQLVSLGKPAYAYSDGKLHASTAKLTDGSTTGLINWVNSGGDKVTYIDLEASYAISKVVVDRTSGFGPETAQFEMYASDTLYETITAVKANADLIGKHESTEAGIDVTFTPATAVQGQYVYLVATTRQSILEITVYADTVIKNAIEQVVSVGKPAYVYVDGELSESKSVIVTDGDTTKGLADHVNSGGNKATYIDLGSTQAISKVILYRRNDSEVNGACSFYASDIECSTITDVKAKAILIGSTTETGTTKVTFTPEKAVAGRYVYLTPDTAQGVHEIEVYAKATREAADISATKATSIEFENYAPEFADAYGVTPIESSSYNVTKPDNSDFVEDENIINHTSAKYPGNGKAVFIKNVSATESTTIEIPVKITGDGWYSTDAQLGGGQLPEQFSNVTMTLADADGKEIYLLDGDCQHGVPLDDTVARVENPCLGRNIYGFSGQTNYIKEGNYTLKVTVDPYKNAALLILDYLKFIPVTPTEVNADGETKIEMEDLDVQYSNIIYEGASGGRTLYSSYGTARSKKANVYNIPVNVNKAGYYDISTVMNKRISNYYSTVSVAVDGKKLYDNTVDGEVTNITGDEFEVHKYTTAVRLDPSVKAITMTVTCPSSIHRFVADCITIQRSIPAYISGAEELEFLGAVKQEDNTYSVAFGIKADELLTTKTELVMVTEENTYTTEEDAFTTDLFGANSIIHWNGAYTNPEDGKLMFAIQIDNVGAEYITDDGETQKFKLYAK